MIRLTVLGTPVAQHRPRITTIGKFPRTYTSKVDTNYREKLYWEAKKLNMRPIARTIPLTVTLRFYRPYPKSMSERKRKISYPTTKPDVDNYIKQAFDALNGIVWEDDAQIVDCMAIKRYSGRPRLELRIEELKSIFED